MSYKTIGFDIDNRAYQKAIARALGEGKTVNQVVADYLNAYAGSTSQPTATTTPTTTTTTPTPKPATTTPKPVATTTTTKYHVVTTGDTLGSIATKYYGTANQYFIIQKANNLTNPSHIWVGQRLIIPSAAGSSTTTNTGGGGTTSQPTTTVPSSIPVIRTTTGSNEPPSMNFVGSPNFNKRSNGEISAIVMHATANGSLEGVVNWFNRTDAQVSAHYSIGKDGAIVQHVRDEHRAWHAGKSEWKGRSDLNTWSIGIELVNWNNGQDPYPEVQHQANLNLVAYLCERYKIKPELIVAHYDISPRRKTDPKNYDMDRLRREVAARL